MAMNLIEANGWNTYSPTEEEMHLIHDCIFLPLTLVVIENNRQQLDKNARSLRPIFVKAANVISARIEADITKARRQLLHQSIILNEGSNGSISYTCRGLEKRLTFSREYIRTEINARINAYTKSIFSHHD